MKTTLKKTAAAAPETYEALVRLLAPRPIHDKVALANAQEVVDLLSAREDLNKDQEDYLDILSQMIEGYESLHSALKPVQGVALLKALLETNGLTGDDLAGILDVDRSTAYKLLRKDRALTVGHIKLLAKHFAVGPDGFIE